jgi:hypothetical protein
MQASLLEILRSIPDHRRAEGKRFDLSTVLLYTILAMVAGANSYRQMHEFIRTHLQRLNEWASDVRGKCAAGMGGGATRAKADFHGATSEGCAMTKARFTPELRG